MGRVTSNNSQPTQTMIEELKHSKSDSSAPSGRLHPIVVPVDEPTENGWWWGRSKDNPLTGDEFCVEVSIAEGGRVTLYWGRDWGHLDQWEQFHGCEWIKATSPWHNAKAQTPPDSGTKDHE